MSARELLERCHQAGVRVRADGPDLIVRGRLGADLIEELRTHKPAVLDYLRQATLARVHPCARCGRLFVAEPAVLCDRCRCERDGRPGGPPCRGCGEACEECLGHPTPGEE